MGRPKDRKTRTSPRAARSSLRRNPTALAHVLVKSGIPLPVADQWIARGFSTVMALRWHEAGFNPKDADAWNVGPPPHAAAAYRDAGFEVATIRTWWKLRSPPDELQDWIDCWLTVDEAMPWRLVGIPPRAAVEWHKSGFTPERARPWREAGMGAEDSVHWRNAGFSARLASDWRRATNDPDDVRSFQRAGFVFDSARTYLSAGIDAPTASQWRQAGLPPDAAVRLSREGLSVESAVARYRGEQEEHRRRLQQAEQERALEAAAIRVQQEVEMHRLLAEEAARLDLREAKRRMREENRESERLLTLGRTEALVARIQAVGSADSGTASSVPDRLFGSPRTSSSLAVWCKSLRLAATGDSGRAIESGLEQASVDRWGGAGPSRLGHTDVRAIRAIVAKAAGPPGEWSRTVESLLYRSLTYLVSPVEIDLYLEGDRPDGGLSADIRLPWPQVTVLFGADFQLSRRHLHLLPMSVPAERLPYERYLNRGIVAGASLFGVVLTADDNSVVRNEVAWLIRVGTEDGTARAMVPGLRSQSSLAPLLSNIDIAVSWAGWDPTDDSPPEARKARRSRSSSRPSPETAERVVDVRARKRLHYGQAQNAGPSTTPHKRRGHWRRQRIGPRDAWHYEIRWIHPTLVGGSLQPDKPERIYRIPS